VYAGPVTRFVVDLDGGGRLIALEGNGHQAGHDDLGRGDRVELVWHREHLIEVPDGGPAPQSSADDSSTAQRSSQ
jgi:putative spermidine/putrescine transport system ATP-binding protein